jgi:hypothetical protein
MTRTAVYLHVGGWVHPIQAQVQAQAPGMQYVWSHPHLADLSAGTLVMLMPGSRP